MPMFYERPKGLSEGGERLDGIRRIRLSQKLTLKELSDKTGIGIGSLSQYERGLISPTAGLLERIAAGLGVKVKDLFDAGEEKHQIKITLVWERKELEGEMNMSGDGFFVFLGDDGTVGIKGGAKFSSRAMINDVVERIRRELLFGYDSQVMRGVVEPEE